MIGIVRLALRRPYVTQRNTDVGALINAGSGGTGQALFEIADLHKVRIYVQVPQTFTAPGQQFAASVQVGRDLGDAVEVTTGLSPSDRVIDSPPETLQTGEVVQLAATAPSPGARQAAAR